MDDRELVELAAVAGGITGQSFWGDNPIHRGIYVGGRYWNPLYADSDALRLAVKLNLHEAIRTAHQLVSDKTDMYAATRRAITRAAAEMGKGFSNADR